MVRSSSSLHAGRNLLERHRYPSSRDARRSPGPSFPPGRVRSGAAAHCKSRGAHHRAPGPDPPATQGGETGSEALVTRTRKPALTAPFASEIRRARSDSLSQEAREAQRMRILSATVRVASEHGSASATVTRVADLAGVSRNTFYALFKDRNDCLRAAFEESVALAAERAGAVYTPRARWTDRVRVGLAALLEFLDEEPELAQFCVVQALAAGPATLDLRTQVLSGLAEVVDAGRLEPRAHGRRTPLSAEGAVCAVLGVIHARLLAPRPPELTTLLNPLMALVVLPYLGIATASRELDRPPARPARQSSTTNDWMPLAGLDMCLTYRRLRALEAIAAEPGLSNLRGKRTSGDHRPGAGVKAARAPHAPRAHREQARRPDQGGAQRMATDGKGRRRPTGRERTGRAVLSPADRLRGRRERARSSLTAEKR